MKGYPDGSFSPSNHITRAEAVVLLDRALELMKASSPATPTGPAITTKGAVTGGGGGGGGGGGHETPQAVDKAALQDAISAANTNKGSVTISTDGKDVAPDNKWVTQAEAAVYTGAITAAQAVVDRANATQGEVDAAVTALASANAAFDSAKKAGTKAAEITVDSLNPTLQTVGPGVFNILFAKSVIESNFTGTLTSDTLKVTIKGTDYEAVYQNNLPAIAGPGWLAFNIQGCKEQEIGAGVVTAARY
jgi:hypothetical protein